MENFFYDEDFCADLDDLAQRLDIDEDNVNNISDSWIEKVELTDLEPIFDITAESLCQILADTNEDRLTEDFDEEERVLNALRQSIDFDKLKDLLPKLHYPNGKFIIVNKVDLLEWFRG